MDLIAKSLMGSYAKGPIDPYFEYTTLLLRGNGLNGAQNGRSGPAAAYRDGTFLDSSTNNFTITRNGNATQGTFSPFSQTGWGNYFNGSYLTVPSGADFNLGTNDFCIEFWLNPITPATYGGILSFDDGDYPLNFSYASANSSNLQANFGTTSAWLYTAFFDTSTATNEWAHYVATRSGSTFRLFKNGVLKATGTSSGTIGNSSNNIRINANGGSAGTTYISNLRIINGSIPTTYQTSSTTTGTTIFTVPTSPLTTTSQGATAADVKLLTCQSNRFIDNSTNNFTITKNGDTRVVAFSPFNPTESWSAATYGGSGYFDGSGDYLTIASNSAFNLPSDFTMEAWCYFTSRNASYTSVIQYNTSVYLGTEGTQATFYADTSTAIYLKGGTIQDNAWNHIAVARSGSTVRLWLNGVSVGTATNSGTVGGATPSLWINSAANGTSYQSAGYYNGIRIVKGTAVYDPTQSTLTVPTAPLTAITNTSLLLNFTNAGIYDATSKNDLETVGNAQISTAQYKFPPSSMVFDGSGDYLFYPSNQLYDISSGDFTVECWVYRSSTQVSTYPRILTIGNANYSALVFWTSGTTITVDVSTSGGTWTNWTFGGATITNDTWTHLALVRSSGSISLYKNGTAQGTSVSNTSFLLATPVVYVGTLFSPASNYFTGYIQDLRITRGYARYTANFTPPTAAFPTL